MRLMRGSLRAVDHTRHATVQLAYGHLKMLGYSYNCTRAYQLACIRFTHSVKAKNVHRLRIASSRRSKQCHTPVSQLRFDNRELFVGDTLCLFSFALYKQITAIIFLPTFPGWLAPIAFNPVRFVEFGCFSATLIGTWVACAGLLGGYKTDATADLPTALSRTCLVWLCSQPVAAAQLVLLTAAEAKTLVGIDGFASVLPLAATGPGEPFATTAGVLGLMAVWRCWYTAYLDFWNIRTAGLGRRVDRGQEARALREALLGTALLSVVCSGTVQVIQWCLNNPETALMLMPPK